MIDIAAVFAEELDKAVEAELQDSGFPVEEWFYAGRTAPQKVLDDWKERGPRLVDRFISWFESSGYEVWTTPDGQPAIELELRPVFGKIPVHMFVDLVLRNEYGLCVVDLKSGSTAPGWQQIGLYASGVELAYGIRPLYGTFYIGPGKGRQGASDDDKTYFLPPRPLSGYRYSVDYYTRELELLDRGISSSLFTASPGDQCRRCPVQQGCLVAGGSDAHIYDSAHPAFSNS